MKPAAEQLEALLETINFNEPVIEFVNNVDARSEQDVARIKSALVRQLYCPVRWCEAIQYIEQNYLASCLVELGPGKTLAGLVKRIAKGIDRFSTCEPELFSEAFSHINK
jgi:[acyl-carrier-protein] S-malonyltransferase